MSRRTHHDWFVACHSRGGRVTLKSQVATPHRRSLRFEPLEDRRLLSVTVESPSGGASLDPILPGDFNVDRTVNAADYTLWRDTLGSTTELSADVSFNGVVDDADYNVWRENFGATRPDNGLAALLGSGSGGDAILVTTLADTIDFVDGLTSLREAIFAANIVGGPQSIEFAESLTAGGPATILLTQGELAITDAVTINGPGADLLAIDASGNDLNPEVFGDGSRIFNIDDGVGGNAIEVDIRGLTLTGGDVSGNGGAILSREKLVASELIVTDNWALSGGGFAVFISGATTTIENSTITGNTSVTGGGAILVQASGPAGTVVISGNTISGNTANMGGAIAAGQAPPDSAIIITGNEITDNSATQQGGALFLVATPRTTITASTISGNTSGQQGGAIFAQGARDLSILGTTISDNQCLGTTQGRGGGIYAIQSELAITGSTISGNMAAFGGGIDSRTGELAIQFSTVADNTATLGDGGGILSSSDRLSLLGSTISGNAAGAIVGGNGRGGGLWFMAGFQTAPPSIVNSTLSGNSASTEGGGAYFRTIPGDSPGGFITLTNVDVAENSAGVHGGGIAMGPGTQALAGTLAVNGGSIRGNTAGVHGGGVYARASSLSFNATTITGNTAQQSGGGIATPMSGVGVPLNLLFVGTTISDNVAGAGPTGGSFTGVGGGVWVPAGTSNLTFVNTEVLNNTARRGGGLFRSSTGPAGLFNVIDSQISGNTAVIIGGGIYNQGGFLSVTGTTISENSVTNVDGTGGGGIASRQAAVALVNSSLTGNSTAGGLGGGMNATGGAVTVTATTIAGNFARGGGGGLWAIGTPSSGGIAIHSSTVSGNSSQIGAGGISVQGFSSIRHSTITLNSTTGGQVGGVDSGRGGALELDHTIIAENTSGEQGANDLLALTAQGLTARFSLIGDNRGTPLAEAPVGSPDVNGNLIGRVVELGGSGIIDPLVAPLGYNGGPTLTHALLPGSPALDGGALVTGPPQGYDQRGNPFSRMVDGTGDGVVRIDIGAYESQGVPHFSLGDYDRNGLVDACDFVLWRDTLGSVVTPFEGADGDGDGVVDQDDRDVWASHFGQGLVFTLGGGSASAESSEQAVFARSTPPQVLASQPPASPGATRVRVGRSARFEPSTLRHDDALLAWLASHQSGTDADHDAGIRHDSDGETADAQSESLDAALDAAFASLGD